MLMSSSIYVTELSRSVPLSYYLDDRDEICLKTPMFYKGQSFEKGRVYVCALEAVAALSFPYGSLFVCSGKPQSPRPVGIASDIIIADCDVQTLFNYTLAAFEKFQQWEQGNNDILTAGGNIVQELLDLAAVVHNNMFHILDANFVTSALSFNGEPCAEYAYARVLSSQLGKPLGSEEFENIQNDFKTASLKRKPEIHPGPVITTLDISMLRGDVYLGMLSMMQYNRPFERGDYAVVEILGRYVEYAIAIESQRVDKNSDFENLNNAFSQLLASKHVSKKTIARLFDAVGFGLEDSFAIIAIRPKQPSSVKYWEYVCNSLVKLVKKAVVCSGNSSYAILVNTTVNSRKEEWLPRLKAVIKNYDMLACIGDEFKNFQHCEPYYTAVFDVLFSLPLDSPAGVYYFSDYRMRLALSNSCGKLMPHMMYCDAFRRLLRYEEGSNVSYLETLRVLLEENMNISSAAKKLYISRNSLLARCERLYRVLDVDMEDARTRFELQYSLYLYDYVHSYG